MKTDRPFFDTHVLLYLLSKDNRKADRAEAIIASGGIISVQVLNVIVSSAIQCGCTVLYSEDMQHGQEIDAQLAVINPFLEK